MKYDSQNAKMVKTKLLNEYFYLLIGSDSKKLTYYFQSQKLLVFLPLFIKYQ